MACWLRCETGDAPACGACLDALPGCFLPTENALTAEMVQELAIACPLLQRAACFVWCGVPEAAAVTTVLPGPLSLEIYTLDGDADYLIQLVEVLRGNAALASLDLSYNDIGDAGAAQLAESLRVNGTLTSLELWETNIGDAGATQLAESLRVNATLTSLDLSCNRIGDAGAAQLAGSLRINTALTSLDLSCNRIGDAGAAQLAESLRVNAALRLLRTGTNSISDAGNRALQAARPPQCVLYV